MSNRTLQRRHYEALAASVKGANESATKANEQRATWGGKPRPLPWAKADAERLADSLAGTNPYFDRARFVAACGFGTWKATRRKRSPSGGLIGPAVVRSPYP